ncbi:MAG: hypothetical protein V1738_01965 [Patescibacteria group bacterium]
MNIYRIQPRIETSLVACRTPRPAHNHGAENFLLCADCCRLELPPASGCTASECECAVGCANVKLCIRHAFEQNRCRVCGKDLETDEATSCNLADRARRRRELNEAIKRREPLKEGEAEQRRRDRKVSGNSGKTRQRHSRRR